MDLPHLKLAKTGNAKYRRRVTSEAMRAMLGKSAVEWSLKTRDPLKIVEAWKVAHARFETLEAKANNTTTDHVEWGIVQAAATKHGLARHDAARIGPVDVEKEAGLHTAFAEVALAEAETLTPQQLSVPFARNPPKDAFTLLMQAKLTGIERPPILLSEVVKEYLRDREGRSTYPDIEKQTALVVEGLAKAMDRTDPEVKDINRDAAYAYRDSLVERGNSIATVQRRITTIKAILNHGERRFDIPDWRNPFNKIELPQGDDVAGEEKRLSLTLEDIRKVQAAHDSLNDDAWDIWHLMMFTGIGPNEARGLQWDEVYLDDATPHFEIKANSRRRLKAGERNRRLPLVGSAMTMMQRRLEAAPQGSSDVFPGYAYQRNANGLSATLIKPMKTAGVWVKSQKVPYSLRHSVKNWLRRTGPQHTQLLIMGHGHGEGRVAGGYGDDDLLDKQAEHLEKALTLGGVIEYPDLPEGSS
ncbi:MAG: site-specific integrase [Pseudomonadota bacterium]